MKTNMNFKLGWRVTEICYTIPAVKVLTDLWSNMTSSFILPFPTIKLNIVDPSKWEARLNIACWYFVLNCECIISCNSFRVMVWSDKQRRVPCGNVLYNVTQCKVAKLSIKMHIWKIFLAVHYLIKANRNPSVYFSVTHSYQNLTAFHCYFLFIFIDKHSTEETNYKIKDCFLIVNYQANPKCWVQHFKRNEYNWPCWSLKISKFSGPWIRSCTYYSSLR